MYSYILIVIAAFMNAVCDRVENENFFQSVFKNMKQEFWYKRVSWQYARKFFGWKFDAWHTAKSFMISCLLGSVVLYKSLLHPAIDFAMLGLAWNAVFNLSYNHLLKRK